MLIGVSGYARSGKDTVGQILVENHGFLRISFAAKLKEAAYALNPWIPIEVTAKVAPALAKLDPKYAGKALQDAAMKADKEFRMRRLKEIVDESGWEAAKEVPEVRRILQRLGTEAGRDVMGQNVWVEAAFNNVSLDQDIVVTDVRFPNEHEAIKQRLGEVWRVTRPGVVAANAHVSETALDDHPFDVWLTNDGTIDELAERVETNVEIARVREPVLKGY